MAVPTTRSAFGNISNIENVPPFQGDVNKKTKLPSQQFNMKENSTFEMVCISCVVKMCLDQIFISYSTKLNNVSKS